jgi:hypothetical protein
VTEIQKITSDMMNAAQAAAYAKCSRSYLVKNAKSGILPTYSLPNRGPNKTGRKAYYFKKAEIKEWMQKSPRLSTREAKGEIPKSNSATLPVATQTAHPASGIYTELSLMKAELKEVSSKLDHLLKVWG